MSSAGVAGKFRSSFSSRQSLSNSSGIPRLRSSQGIRKKKTNQVGENKSTMPKTCVSSKPNKAVKKKPVTEIKPHEPSHGKTLQSRGERKVLSNLSNSPALPKEQKVKKETKNTMFVDQTEFEFKADPNSLANILNNEPLQVENLQRQSDMLFFADGRPSLCRRVPIVRNSFANGRASMQGPGRILSHKKAPRPAASKAQQTFLHQSAATSRHSLYSVVKGRNSHAPTDARSRIQIGRQSLQQGRKTGKQSKIVNTLQPLPFKSPTAQRILSRKNEVRISASPALRIPCPVTSTPPPQRVLSTKRKPLIRWADENDKIVQDKLAVHLFEDSPSSPKVVSKKELPKTPVSILKSRKHTKRNSLTPPVVKKEKKPDLEDDCTIEIISPHLLNEIIPVKKEINASPELPTATIKTEKTSPQHVTQQKQLKDQQSKTTSQQNHIKLKTVSPSGAVTKQKLTDKIPQKDQPATQQKVVDIDKVLNLMTKQISTVKRRSVQAEVLNIYQQMALQLKGVETIAEEVESDADGKVPDIMVSTMTDSEPPKNIPTSQDVYKTQTPQHEPVNKLLTPENMNKLQQSFEETNKSLDELALKTEEIHREMHQLQLDKEKLQALRLQAKLRKENFRNFSTPITSSTNNKQPEETQKRATLADDIFSLDKVVGVDLNNGALEFRNNEQSPILTARIEFKSNPSPEILKQKSSDTNHKTSSSPNIAPQNPFPDDLCAVLSKELQLKNTKTSCKELVQSAHTSNSSRTEVKQEDKGSLPQPLLDKSGAKLASTNCSNSTTNHCILSGSKQITPLDGAGELLQTGDSLLGLCSKQTSHQPLFDKTCANKSSKDFLNITTNRDLQQDDNVTLSLGGATEHKPENTTAGLSSKTCSKIGLKDDSSVNNIFSRPGELNKIISSSSLSPPLFSTTFKPTANSTGSTESSVNSTESSRASQIKNTKGSCQATFYDSYKETKSFFRQNEPTSSHTHSSDPRRENVEMTQETKPFKSFQDSEFVFKKPSYPVQQCPAPDTTNTISRPTPLQLYQIQTPKAFRDLRSKYMNWNKDSHKNKMKNQFAQALLDEEVALLTCRIVKPPSSVVCAKKTVDPVATSLDCGDDTHFVPVVQTPTSGKKKSEIIGNGSAFSAYSAHP
uniref:Uncharacterized protein LOC100177706 n=1 Tax=Phallusia mammillata TaxID=59560 RepID=A0A6F9DH92_9ASCI|nr:uncharacterized protein LOC100177706 [Phallusia mammillata]